MKILHYSNQFGSVPLHRLLSDFGETVTDRSFFRPDVSTARAKLGSLIANGSNKVGVYDFPDGKDTGQSLMIFLRNKSLDQTEIDSAYERIKANAERLKQGDVEKFISDNNDKDSKAIRESLKQFLNRDTVSEVVSSAQSQNIAKSAQ